MIRRRVSLLALCALIPAIAACSGGKGGSSVGYAGGDPARDKLRAAATALLRVATTLADGVTAPLCAAMGLNADLDLAVGRNPLDVDACLQLVGALPTYLIQRLSSKEDYFTLTDEEQSTVGFADAVPMGKIHFTRKGVLALSEPLVWALVAHELIHTRPTGTYFPSSLGDERSDTSERFISAAAATIASVAVLLNGWDKQPNFYAFSENGVPLLKLDLPSVVDVQSADLMGDTGREIFVALGDEGAMVLDGQVGAPLITLKGRHVDSVSYAVEGTQKYLVVGDATRNDGIRVYRTDGTLHSSKLEAASVVRNYADSLAVLTPLGGIHLALVNGLAGETVSLAENTHYRQLARVPILSTQSKRLVCYDSDPTHPDVAALYYNAIRGALPRDYFQIGFSPNWLMTPPAGTTTQPWGVGLPKGGDSPAPVYLAARAEVPIPDVPSEVRGVGAMVQRYPDGTLASFPVFVRERNVIVWDGKLQKARLTLPVPGMTDAIQGTIRGVSAVFLFRRSPAVAP